MGNKPHIRLVFVQLLFALAIGQLALKVGDVIIGRKVEHNLYSDILTHPFVYSHLFLCVFLISASWVGWQASKASDSPQLAGFVISIEYLILLVDIFLVIAYFMIVRGTEVSSTQAIITGNTMQYNFPVQPPDSFTERLWVMIIFFMYFIWDLLTKIFKQNFVKHEEEYKISKIPVWEFKRSSITVICWLASVFTLICFKVQTENTVLAVDIMLIAIIWAFRGWKQTIKQHYKLDESQLPSYIQKQFKDAVFPIKIIESRRSFIIKRFVARYLPIIIFIFSIIYYCVEVKAS